MTTTGEVNSLATRIGTEFKSIRTVTGTLANLDTTDKDSLVDAINEVFAAIGGAGATIDDGTISTLSVWSSDKTNDEIIAAVTALVGGAPGALDTLNELAAAINDDASYAATIATALGLKAADSAVVHLTGNETIAGAKTFSAAPAVPDGSFAIAKTTGLQAALDAKFTTASASATAQGIVELATDAEATTGTDTVRAVTPANVRAVVGDQTTNFVITFEAALL